MNKIILAFALLVTACTPAAKQNYACLGTTLGQAVKGDFHDIVLPAFVGGQHLQAGQVSSCMAP